MKLDWGYVVLFTEKFFPASHVGAILKAGNGGPVPFI